MGKFPISLCTFVKNEATTVIEMLESAVPIVSDIVVVDTGSTDNTVDICKRYTNRVYQIPFSDFGSIRTITAHLASMPWVLMLDADERIVAEDYGKFAELINQKVGTATANYERDSSGEVVIDSWALPRKRWADLWMRKQLELESWPDWQVRLFRNHPDRRIKFVRRVHETVEGCIRTEHSIDGPVIHHFQGVGKNNERAKERQHLYTSLYEADIEDGIHHSEPPIVSIDKVE